MTWSDMGVVASLLMAAVAVYLAVSSRRRNEADASAAVTAAAMELVEPLRARIDELEENVRLQAQEIRKLRGQNRALRESEGRLKERVRLLEGAMKAAGLEVPPGEAGE